MRFSIEQRFAAPLDRVLTAYTDPELYPTLTGFTKIGTPAVLAAETSGDEAHLRLHMQFIAEVSSAVSAVVDPRKLSWVQDEVYDLGQGTAVVRFEPDNYADRFTCVGGYRFEPAPDDPSRTIRTISGDLKIRVLLVGGQAEKAMVMGLTEHFAEEQPEVQAWLDARR